MRLLLDENLPKRLKGEFPGHEVFTVRDKGWNGIKNGALLQRMIDENFGALVTFDKNLQHQQNFLKYPITVFVISASNNTFEQIQPLISVVLHIIKDGKLMPGPVTVS